MQSQADKFQDNKSQAFLTTSDARVAESKSASHLQDNRPKSVVQRKQLEAMAQGSPIQQKNATGLPDQLKSGIESLSGHSMDDVKVHYNSAKPAQLNAHAYAQETDIHIAAGQEKHPPHEAWHVVQQKQGRVRPNMQMKRKVNINDDKRLEKEADVMSGRAMQMRYRHGGSSLLSHTASVQRVAQRVGFWDTVNTVGGGLVKGAGMLAGAAGGVIGAASGAVVGAASGLYNEGLSVAAVKHAGRKTKEGWQKPTGAVGELMSGAATATGATLGGILGAARGAYHRGMAGVVPGAKWGADRGAREPIKALALAGGAYMASSVLGLGVVGKTLAVGGGALMGYGEPIGKKLSYVQKKLDDNPALKGQYKLTSMLRLGNNKGLRKANRISGLLANKHPDSVRSKASMKALNELVLYNKSPVNALLAKFDHKPDITLRGYEINQFILTACKVAEPSRDFRNLERDLDIQWGTIEGKEPFKVVSHRGDGATFDKLGDYSLPRHAHDQIYRHEDENSETSVRKTMTSWTDHGTKLSGIECDVHLSQDNVPIVTHTVAIGQQLTQEGRMIPWGLGPDHRIATTLSTALDPRFMTLARWLDVIENYIDAKARHNADRKKRHLPIDDRKVRLEIEMKHVGVMDKPGDLSSWDVVGKIVSEFLKKTKHSHMIEIAMFNNTGAPLEAHKAAKSKTMLSHVVYSRGGAPEASLKEVRFGMHQKGIKGHLDTGALDSKMVTFAPGLDFPATGTGRQLHPVHSLPTALDMTIEQSIQSARHARLVELMMDRKRRLGQGPVSVHTLTDHGALGANLITGTGRLSVGGQGLGVPYGYDARHVIAYHNMLNAHHIFAAVREAQRQGNPALIGQLLIQWYPELL